MNVFNTIQHYAKNESVWFTTQSGCK